ncbi:MAG: DUF2189 domain-containing protein [Alphaproteobacteria bacterium]
MIDATMEQEADAAYPTIEAINASDLKEVLKAGVGDFMAMRTDVLFLALIYPVVMLAVARLAFGSGLLELVFPMATGLALLGPLVATGLYEISRLRERGEFVSWRQSFSVFASPRIWAVLTLGVGLLAIFVFWLAAAAAVYQAHYGDMEPPSLAWFFEEVLTTGNGWSLIIIGHAVGAVFAGAVLAISAVSFPMIVDRNCTAVRAVLTSLKVFAANPVPMILWGLIVAVLMMAGTLPLFVGLIVVMPVLGHASWHLYRRTVTF